MHVHRGKLLFLFHFQKVYMDEVYTLTIPYARVSTCTAHDRSLTEYAVATQETAACTIQDRRCTYPEWVKRSGSRIARKLPAATPAIAASVASNPTLRTNGIAFIPRSTIPNKQCQGFQAVTDTSTTCRRVRPSRILLTLPHHPSAQSQDNEGNLLHSADICQMVETHVLTLLRKAPRGKSS